MAGNAYVGPDAHVRAAGQSSAGLDAESQYHFFSELFLRFLPRIARKFRGQRIIDLVGIHRHQMFCDAKSTLLDLP